jgi:glycosyltransferase involved in cell wall biosynthesis
LKVNIAADELRKIYREAKIFWHFSGYKQRDPSRFEHFGMTTVEAMQNRCVPVVFDGGGLGEIVEHQVSGYLFTDMTGMTSMTLDLIRNPSSLTKMSEGAFARGKKFTKEAFAARVREHFSRLLRKYSFQHLKGE